MLQGWVIVAVSFAYLGVLFAIAYYGDKRAGARPLHHREPVHLRALARGVLHHLDVLRQRRAGGVERHRLPPGVPRAHAHGAAVVVRDAEDPPHQQGVPHHVDRRLRRVALRQEPAARRARHGHRGARRDPVHLAAAQGDLRQLHDPAALPGHRHAGAGAGAAVPAGQRALHRDDARGVHDPVRDAPPRRDRAARGARRGDRLRVRGEAARVPGRRGVRDVRHLPRLRRRLPPGRAAPSLRGLLTVPSASGELRHLGVPHAPVDARRSCSCRGSSRSPSSRTWTRTTSARRSGSSRSTSCSSTCSSCRSRSAGSSSSPAPGWTRTRSCSRCPCPSSGRR